MMPLSGTNVAFNREIIGPALFLGLRLVGEGKMRWETVEDVFPECVLRLCRPPRAGGKEWISMRVEEEGERNAIDRFEKGMGRVKLMEVVPFFQTARLSRSAVTAEDCVIEIAKMVKEQLGPSDGVFARAADAM
ncbi:hypothetical protein IFM89_029103 [Coptis chinensis]|uniref:Uncharacterized protein n=1 Tax=Coptis chinensis TaxID=261450 RepID=A0A835M4Q0_9MAGN|nr:hypothetical protein IFM89_029103 [Coptis chinensis]